jgi:hypothetical protein
MRNAKATRTTVRPRPAPRTRLTLRDATLGRVAGILGLVFVAVEIAGVVVLSDTPRVDAPVGEVIRFYSANSDRLLTYAFVHGLALTALLVFAGAAHAFLVEREGTRRTALPSIFVISLTTVVVLELLLRCAAFAALGLRHADLTPETMVVLHTLGTLTGSVIPFAVAPTWAAFGLLAWRTGLPRWLAASSVLIGSAWLVAALRIASTTAWLFRFFRVSFGALIALVIVASLYLALGRTPEATSTS